MSNSPLVDYVKLSPNCSSRCGAKIDKITIHHVAGVATVEGLGEVFAPVARQASANYGIGSDGRIGLYVDERDRAWTSGSFENDCRAVTIEVSNSAVGEPWPVSDLVLGRLIDLCEDICRRNGIERINYTGDATGNLTMHRWFQPTACVPVSSEVLTRNGWVKISDVEVGDEIACADINDLRISFEEVYDKVPTKKQDVYVRGGLAATKDHRMVFRTKLSDIWRIDTYNRLLRRAGVYLPLAGKSCFDGLSLTDDMIRFYVAVQADGHYMYETTVRGARSYYGLEFHLKKKRKIDRIKELLERIGLPYRENGRSNGSISIRIYNTDETNIVKDICEKWLHEKCFTWAWLDMSPHQAAVFLDEILSWDGCKSASKYSSAQKINLDVVSAIAAINNVGSRVVGSDVIFREAPHMTLLSDKTSRLLQKDVTCVSVKTGIFLCRQNGKTFIVGNCPGDYLAARFPYIAEKINERLEENKPMTKDEKAEFEALKKLVEKISVSVNEIRADLGAIEGQVGAEYNAGNIPDWAASTVAKLEGKGYLKGTGNGLELSFVMLRILVILDRAGVFE